MDTVIECVYIFEQFQMVLDSCPQKFHIVSGTEVVPSVLPVEESIVSACKSDPMWESAINKLTLSMDAAKKIRDAIINYDNRIKFLADSLNVDVNLNKLFVTVIFQDVLLGYSKLNDINKNVNDIIKLFCVDFQGESFKNPLTSCLENLSFNINKTILNFNNEKDNFDFKESSNTEIKTDEFRIKVGSLTNKILLIIQEFYKLFTSDNKELDVINFCNAANEEETVEVKATDEDNAYESIVEGHIKDKLLDSLNNFSAVLKIKEINAQLFCIIEELGSVNDDRLKVAYLR